MTGARFLLNGAPHEAPAHVTLLDHLRGAARLTGVKEGCAEGDCGACTVALGRVENGRFVWRAVNACILLAGQADGAAVQTVEGLAALGGPLHPVQQALLEADATQCGFCTPGFVMSLFAFHHGGEAGADATIHEALAGNLCRCTGYRPIVEAAKAVAGGAAAARPAEALPEARAPRRLDELLALLGEGAVIWGGGTDLGLTVSKGRTPPTRAALTRDVAELRLLELTEGELRIGGAVTYAEAQEALDLAFPAFGALLRRLGSRQIRNVGTLAGNIGTASPIGDTLPVLLALDARIQLVSTQGRRAVAASDYFLDYRRTAKRPDEVIETIVLPRLAPGERVEVHKLSKRFDQDISSVIGAFRLQCDRIVRAAYGGMAAIPKRSMALEAGIDPDAAIAADFAPLSDLRASATYRRLAAANLARRVLSGAPTLEAL